ncbi:hypothetical protein SODG_003114 [Sodalis praecaptivus]
MGFLREAGAELSTVESRYFLLGLISRAQAIGLRDPGWTLLSQHLNLLNVAVHQYQTGQEIRRQLANEQADGWVAAVGTGGTLSGVYKALVQDNPALVVRGTTPSELPFGTYDPPMIGINSAARAAWGSVFGNPLSPMRGWTLCRLSTSIGRHR